MAASYRQAIAWMAMNDDTEWVKDNSAPGSVTAALVADLFDKTDEKVRTDLKRYLIKIERLSPDKPTSFLLEKTRSDTGY